MGPSGCNGWGASQAPGRFRCDGGQGMDVSERYDGLVEQGNDPFRDPPALRAYMDRWNGREFVDTLHLSGDKMEIGVGTGRIAARVASLCRRRAGIDISPKTIGRTQENLVGFQNIQPVCADFLRCEFQEQSDVPRISLGTVGRTEACIGAAGMRARSLRNMLCRYSGLQGADCVRRVDAWPMR